MTGNKKEDKHMSEVMKFEDYKQYLNPVFAKQTDLVAKKARGCYLWDVNGEKFCSWYCSKCSGT